MGPGRKRNQYAKDYEKKLKEKLAPFTDVPILVYFSQRKDPDI